MNTKDEENGAPGSPLIFTVPAYGFVMALYLDWVGQSYLGALPPKPLRKRLIQARTAIKTAEAEQMKPIAPRRRGLGETWT